MKLESKQTGMNIMLRARWDYLEIGELGAGAQGRLHAELLAWGGGVRNGVSEGRVVCV